MNIPTAEDKIRAKVLRKFLWGNLISFHELCRRSFLKNHNKAPH